VNNSAAADLASLRATYRQHRTVYEHQELACNALGFHSLTETRRRALVYALREALTVTLGRMRLMAFGRQWLYDRKLLVTREKGLRQAKRKCHSAEANVSLRGGTVKNGGVKWPFSCIHKRRLWRCAPQYGCCKVKFQLTLVPRPRFLTVPIHCPVMRRQIVNLGAVWLARGLIIRTIGN